MTPPATPSWWQPDNHHDRRPILLGRGRIKHAIRTWFEAQGYIEVDTACLQVSPGNETHLHAFKTELIAPDGAREPYYLHTSPEFACKKLLTAGEAKIFTFAPVFRNRERSALHHPEFTMLEWYEAGVDYFKLAEQCCSILKLAAGATDYASWQFAGCSADPYAAPERITVGEAFQRFGAIDLLATLNGATPDRSALADQAISHGLRVSASDTWSDIFSRILLEKVEPALKQNRPIILDEYPLCEAALARASMQDPRVGERFEVYCCGVELANGFGELTDAAAQRTRFIADMDEKARRYGERYPLDEEFLAALEYMPAAAGCALGFDRLVMLATGAQRIEQVIWTPLPAMGQLTPDFR